MKGQKIECTGRQFVIEAKPQWCTGVQPLVRGNASEAESFSGFQMLTDEQNVPYS